MPIILFGMYFIKRYTPGENNEQDEKEEINNDRDEKKIASKESNPLLKTILMLLIFLANFATNIIGIFYLIYAPTYYQYFPNYLSARTSATVMSVLSTAYVVGRGVLAIVKVTRNTSLGSIILLSRHFVQLLLGGQEV